MGMATDRALREAIEQLADTTMRCAVCAQRCDGAKVPPRLRAQKLCSASCQRRRERERRGLR